MELPKEYMINSLVSLFKRENNKNIPFTKRYSNCVLPITSTNDTSRCRDFDLNKSNCLSNKPKKIKIAAIYPVLDTDYVAIDILDCSEYCDMV